MRKHLSSFGNNQITQIQKSREKRCLHVVPCLNKRSNQLGSLCSQKRERHDQHHGELHSRILKIERGIRRRTALTRGPGQSRPGLSLFIELGVPPSLRYGETSERLPRRSFRRRRVGR